MIGKRDFWFRNYQEIPGVRRGKRKYEARTAGFDMQDFAGKTVLDLGCNLGQTCLFAEECSARYVLGVEYDEEAFVKANRIKNKRGTSVIEYKMDDLDNPLFWHHITPFDTVLLLSVIDTKELENRFGIISRACMKCNSVFYLEGHKHQPPSKYFWYIVDNTDFTQVEYVGSYEGRALFRCSRDVLDTNGFYSKMSEVCARYSRIGVVGNELTGKSTLCRGLTAPGFTILDDCDNLELIQSCRKMVLFDYAAAQYANDLDVVFNLLQSQDKTEATRCNHHRSSAIAPSDTIRCLYTVRTH